MVEWEALCGTRYEARSPKNLLPRWLTSSTTLSHKRSALPAPTRVLPWPGRSSAKQLLPLPPAARAAIKGAQSSEEPRKPWRKRTVGAVPAGSAVPAEPAGLAPTPLASAAAAGVRSRPKQ